MSSTSIASSNSKSYKYVLMNPPPIKNYKKCEVYYYCGQHTESYDKHGPIPIYHYISKSELGNRKLKDIPWHLSDMEIWPGDLLWSKACTKQNIIIEVTDIDDNENDNMDDVSF